MTDKDVLINAFMELRSKGFVKSNRSNNTGIGKTLEDCLDIDENNLSEPDFLSFEVKSKRAETSSYLTLFTKSPSHPRQINALLCKTYGEEYAEYPGLKRLHTSVFSGKCNTYRDRYGFKILNDRENRKIVLEISDLDTGLIIDDRAHWTYDSLERCVNKKLTSLFYVTADSKIIEGQEYFHYKEAEIYAKPSFERLLKLIDEGRLMVDLRIGSYKSGVKKGKPHDHGTGFRIKPSDLGLLYSEYFKID